MSNSWNAGFAGSVTFTGVAPTVGHVFATPPLHINGNTISIDTSVIPSAGVDSVVAGTGISVDNTDPHNPIVTNASTAVVESIVAGSGVTVDDTDPANPIVSASGGGGTIVQSYSYDYDEITTSPGLTIWTNPGPESYIFLTVNIDPDNSVNFNGTTPVYLNLVSPFVPPFEASTNEIYIAGLDDNYLSNLTFFRTLAWQNPNEISSQPIALPLPVIYPNASLQLDRAPSGTAGTLAFKVYLLQI